MKILFLTKTKGILLHKIILLLGLFILLPFFILSYYNYPYLDDFSVCVLMREQSFIEFNVNWYLNKGGRFFYIFLLSIFALFDSHLLLLVKVIPPIIFLFLFHALFTLIKQFTDNVSAYTISLLFIFLYFINLSSIHETLFWVSSLLINLLGGIFLIYFLNYYSKISTNESKRNLFLVGLFAFVLVGFTETMPLLMIVFFCFIFLIQIIKFKRLNKSTLFIFVFIFIGALIVILAPGNFVRLNTNNFRVRDLSEVGIIIHSFFDSFYLFFKNIVFWFKSFYLILCSVLILYYFIMNKKKWEHNSIFNIKPYFSLLLFFLIPAIYYPSFYGVSFVEKRLIDFSYLIFLFIWFYNLIILYVYLSEKLKTIKLPFNLSLTKLSYITFGLIIFLLVIKPNHVRTIYGDIFKGRLTEFKTQINKRHIDIQNCPKDNCIVNDLYNEKSNIPYALFSADFLNPSPKHWVNRAYGGYFYIDSIYIPFPNNKEVNIK